MAITRVGLSLMSALVLCLPQAAKADELVDRLSGIPGLTVVHELPVPDGFRFFVLTYEQPVNHLMPWKGVFLQRLTLLHRAVTAPTIVNTSGYDISLTPSRSEPTQILDGNELTIEHRFFLPSRPDPADWQDLTILQAATDHHRVINAFKVIYGGRWLTTGRSKGGMAAVYHRRFFPRDVDGTIAYVAPNDVINHRDRYEEFLDNVGDDPACRQRITTFQRDALLRRQDVTPIMEAVASDQGLTFNILGSADRAYEFLVVDWAFGFWQLGGASFCGLVPPPGAPAGLVFAALDAAFGFAFYTDQGIEPLFPLYFQQDTQIGIPIPADGQLTDLLRFPGENVPRAFLPATIPAARFDHRVMLDIDLFVRLFASELMFIYGENDPWSAEPFRPGPGTRDSFVYLVPSANHSARIAGLPPNQQAEAVAVMRRWANQAELSDALTPRVESLDRMFELEAARPHRRR